MPKHETLAAASFEALTDPSEWEGPSGRERHELEFGLLNPTLHYDRRPSERLWNFA